jgi:DNA polymerase III delta subunit
MILFFYGDDSYSLRHELAALRAKFFLWEELMIDPELTDHELRSRLQESLESQGLFAKKKLVILRNFLDDLENYPETREYLEKASANLSPDITLAFAQTESCDKRLSFFRFLQKKAQVKEFSSPTGKALEAWIKKRLLAGGFEIREEALESFLEKLGLDYNLWQIENELGKLMLYGDKKAQGGKTVTKKMVQQIVPTTVSQSVFDLTNAIAEGRIPDALWLLEQFLKGSSAADSKKEIIQIVGALASQIRSLILVQDFKNQSPGEIAKILGWKEGRVWINLKLAKKFSKERLLKLLADLKAIDLRLKTSEEPPKLLLTLFFQKAATPSLSPP